MKTDPLESYLQVLKIEVGVSFEAFFLNRSSNSATFFINVSVPSVTSPPNGIISGVPFGMLVDKLVNTASFLLFLNSATLSMGEYAKTFLTGENDTRFDMIILIKNDTMTLSFIHFFL